MSPKTKKVLEFFNKNGSTQASMSDKPNGFAGRRDTWSFGFRNAQVNGYIRTFRGRKTWAISTLGKFALKGN